MTDEKVLDYVLSKDRNRIIPFKINNDFFEKSGMKKYVLERFNDSDSIKESIYRIKERIEKRPVCKHCGGKVKYKGQKTNCSENRFAEFCSVSCSRKYHKSEKNNIQLTDELILKDLVNENGTLNRNKSKEKYLKEHGYKDYLIHRYPTEEIHFVKNKFISYSEIIYRMKNKIEKLPVCPFCGNPKFFISFNQGYDKTCEKFSCKTSYKFKNIPNNDEKVISLLIKEDKENIQRIIKPRMKKEWLKSVGLLEYLQKRFEDSESIDETIYRIIHKIEIRPTCPCCGKKVIFSNIYKGFQHYCSYFCHFSSEMTKFWKKEFNMDIEYLGKEHIIIKNGCKIHGDLEVEPKTKYIIQRVLSYKTRHLTICPFCNPIKNPETSIESIIKNILKRNKIKYIHHDRKILKPYKNETIEGKIIKRARELDFYLPDFNIGIECNGNYWHNLENGIIRDKEKRELCRRRNITLLEYWEDEIHERPKDIENDILNKINLTLPSMNEINTQNI